MNKKIDIESGSFQIKFVVNSNLIWMQLGLAAMLAFMLLFVNNPKVTKGCWIMLGLDVIALIVSFIIGIKITVSDAEEEDSTPTSAPAPAVGEKKVSKEKSTKNVSGTIKNKAPLPNPDAVKPPQQTAHTTTVQQSALAPEPAPEVEPTPRAAMSLEEAAASAGIDAGTDPTSLSDDDWAKLFGLGG